MASPTFLQSYAARAVRVGGLRLRANVDGSSAEWENHVALEPLLDPDVALDDVALVLLAIGTKGGALDCDMLVV